MQFTGKRFRKWLGKKEVESPTAADFYAAMGTTPAEPNNAPILPVSNRQRLQV